MEGVSKECRFYQKELPDEGDKVVVKLLDSSKWY